MCIAILCMAMNPHTIFLQTLVGLHCYTYGLRDAGFEILNAIGCTCSINHVRQHGFYWANQRQAIAELNPLSFWRVSIDNLNFKIKFAKNLSTGSTSGLKKMLNPNITNATAFRCITHIEIPSFILSHCT